MTYHTFKGENGEYGSFRVFHLTALEAARDAIDSESETALDFAANEGSLFENVKHMRGFAERLAAEEFKDGWYWQACFPGCLPDGDAFGAYETEAEAIAAANDGA